MRRSICYCEPSSVLAGEAHIWKFIYTTAVALPKGTRLKFDLMSKGRPIDWQAPIADLKEPGNVIYGLVPTGKTHKVLPAREVDVPDNFVPQYEFTLPSPIPAGESFTIVIGPSPETKSKKAVGNTAQTAAQRRRPFLLYVDPTGKGNYDEPETFSLDIRGNALHSIRIITPSYIIKNKRFDIILRFEDQYGNLTNNAPEDTLIELSYENLRENLTWKLFVPETGFIVLPNLYFNEPNIYTIRLKNTKTNEIFRSAPVRCFLEGDKQLFWGLLHGESERIDSTENIESCLRHIRDEKAHNFFASSPFENQEETSNETWKLITTNLAEFDEEERFTTFVAFQWSGEPSEEGLRQFIYTKDQKQIMRKKDAKNSSLKKIYKSFNPKELISIPSFTMAKGMDYDFADFAPDFERVVEIYNAWGSSECTAKEGNPRPIKTNGKVGYQESAKGSIQKALQDNCRFGFVAGGLDDRGIYSELFDSEQVQYTPGLTAILAKDQSRAGIAEALYNRACYATTGERILLGMTLAGSPIGAEINTADKPGLLINRHLSGFVAGTDNLAKVEIIRNGKVIKTWEPDHYSLEFVYDDMTPMDKAVIRPSNKQPPFIYYYIRVTQEDGHMAWSSPIWVDLLPPNPAKAEARRAALVKNVKKQQPIITEEEEEEDEEESEFLDDDSEV
jgi:hypothetical protein